ncbi:unnamed protein product [Somion occarium]|uniref:Uncharacterized protein n=1 Tax=Somion occarium TaxID=3059160 RepID=A0ABP1CRM3_9APHY
MAAITWDAESIFDPDSPTAFGLDANEAHSATGASATAQLRDTIPNDGSDPMASSPKMNEQTPLLPKMISLNSGPCLVPGCSGRMVSMTKGGYIQRLCTINKMHSREISPYSTLSDAMRIIRTGPKGEPLTAAELADEERKFREIQEVAMKLRGHKLGSAD